jgi:hypothetical protein
MALRTPRPRPGPSPPERKLNTLVAHRLPNVLSLPGAVRTRTPSVLPF